MKCCWFCGLEFKELQVCSKCQQEFCIEHIDPINHDCVGYPVPNPFELEEEVILLHEVKDEQEIVEFRGARIYQGEVNTIIGLEQFLTEVFKSVKELPTTVRTSKPWFVVKENHISKISFSKGTNIEILEHLKELKWLETLKAYEMDLIKLPESIGNLTALQHLDLRYNHIKTLPESLTSLSLLKTLYLESNEITELPEFIGNLTSLQHLSLSRNKLTSLPESLTTLSLLKELTLRDNKITELPESIGKLKHLEQLDLCGNKVRILPESFCNLNELIKLNLFGNPIIELPQSIGSLSSLKILDMTLSLLKNLPISFGNLNSLEELYINENLENLPESFGNLSALKKLDLRRNKLTILPDSFDKLPSLKELHLDNILRKYLKEYNEFWNEDYEENETNDVESAFNINTIIIVGSKGPLQEQKFLTSLEIPKESPIFRWFTELFYFREKEILRLTRISKKPIEANEKPLEYIDEKYQSYVNKLLNKGMTVYYDMNSFLKRKWHCFVLHPFSFENEELTIAIINKNSKFKIE